jgi:hypothetical protein
MWYKLRSCNRRPSVMAAFTALAGAMSGAMSLAAADFDISLRHPTLMVFLRNGRDYVGDGAQGALAAMKAEAGSILAAAGIDADWRPMENSNGMEAVSALVVVSLKGKCSFHTPLHTPRLPARAGPFGWTPITDNQVLPFCHIDCDRVRSVVGPSLRHLPQAQQNRILGRALGRVLAHELYHILAGTREHARTGVAKAYLSVSELVLGSIGLGEKEIHRIRDGKYSHLFVAEGQTVAVGRAETRW